eukprot:365814-Chlamydomonas_euryale.AAC.2
MPRQLRALAGCRGAPALPPTAHPPRPPSSLMPWPPGSPPLPHPPAPHAFPHMPHLWHVHAAAEPRPARPKVPPALLSVGSLVKEVELTREVALDLRARTAQARKAQTSPEGSVHRLPYRKLRLHMLIRHSRFLGKAP